jgi:nucleoside-diphosphate-sugar epimerase
VNVFVIGATGYIGSAVAEALKGRGHRVTGLARTPAARASLESRGYDVVDGDVGRPESLDAAARAADAIAYAVQLNDADPFEIDARALRRLAEATAGTTKRLLYTSGVWIYGATGDEAATEDAALQPLALAARRPELERIVLDSASHPIIVRPGIVYGHGGGIPAMFVQSAREQGAAAVVGDGENRWPLVDVDDLAQLFVLALESAPPGAVYNAADERVLEARELAEAASRGAGRGGTTMHHPLDEARKAMGPFADALAADQRVSAERARRELGWRPHARSAVDDLERGSYVR